MNRLIGATRTAARSGDRYLPCAVKLHSHARPTAASDCSTIADLCLGFVDGVLTRADEERVAAHLEQCQTCRVAVAEDANLRRRVRCIAPERAPQSLRTRVEALRRRLS